MHFKYRSHYHSTSLPRHRSAVVLTIHTRHRSEGANILIAENISCITIQWANENITNVGVYINYSRKYLSGAGSASNAIIARQAD